MDAWTAAMGRGDFRAAWDVCDAVLAARTGPPDDPRLPYHLRWVWDGRPFDGRHVLVRCYHGLGDTLQFIRLLPALRARAASVTLEAQPELVPLLMGFAGMDRLVPFDVAHPLPPAECDIEVMELGHALRAMAVGAAGYLIPSRCVPHLSPTLSAPEGGEGAEVQNSSSPPGIAICARAGDWDPERSVPLQALLDASGGQAVLLHRDPENPADPLADIRVTAGILAAARLVITVDTMIAHLAGALGRPTWLLLKAQPDWRWMQPGRVSLWYPTTRLYRQKRPGDWSGPLAEIAADLSRLLSPRACARAG